MKISFGLITLLFSLTIWASIPLGRYQVEKIQCKSGKVSELGGKYMIYNIFLEVGATSMTMSATAQSNRRNVPINVTCLQINQGSYVYTQENKFEGELKSLKSECNNLMWTQILKMKNYGVEPYGTFNYQVNGNKLVIYRTDTETKYSCKDDGDYPIFYYNKI